jgi:alkylation response protein AidB-like acyl-CoA dehydrogenase
MKRKIFDQDHDSFRDSYRRFIQKEVQPYRDAWQEAGIVPRDMFLKMGEQGYLLAWADEAYGGLGLEDFRYQLPYPSQPARRPVSQAFRR